PPVRPGGAGLILAVGTRSRRRRRARDRLQGPQRGKGTGPVTDRHLTIRRWGCGVLLWASANAIVWSCLERRERRLWAEAHGVPLTGVDRFEEQIVAIRRVDGPACGEIGYRLLAPEPVEPNRRYPVVLFLHGAGQRGF